MTDASVERAAKDDRVVGTVRTTSGLKRSIPVLSQPVSIAANVIAAIASFLFLVVVPTMLLAFVPLPDDLVAILLEFLPSTLQERIAAAFGLALLFFVIGIGFQVWQYGRKAASWWPFVLVFPVVAALLVPDAFARGGSIRDWAVFGVALALAFCVHWLAVLLAVELID
jgi:hypothetical protein